MSSKTLLSMYCSKYFDGGQSTQTTSSSLPAQAGILRDRQICLIIMSSKSDSSSKKNTLICLSLSTLVSVNYVLVLVQSGRRALASSTSLSSSSLDASSSELPTSKSPSICPPWSSSSDKSMSESPSAILFRIFFASFSELTSIKTG